MHQGGDKAVKRAKKQIALIPLIGAAAVAGGLVIRAATRSRYSFAGKSVLITGGSRGLGLVVARILAKEGARLTLVARTEKALEAAEAELRSLGAEVLTIAGDIRNREEAAAIVKRAIGHHGSLDVLINNAGVIQVGPFDVMTVQDFEDAMDTHLWGPLALITAALPHMAARGGGRIVNISSIGGRIAVPHLSPYTVSKFALAGLSDSLRAELAPHGIVVTSVYPGLMRTGSHVNANFKGDHEKEFAWFSALAGLPIFSIDARRAARQIVEACRNGRADLVITTQARIAVAANGLFPSLLARMMKVMQFVLPGRGGAAGKELRPGWDSMSEWSPSILTRLADQAIEENNEYTAA
jgi:NAD(P)-dependent dehydrogenase (short-subunit alcohol dehydrogenase family)